MTTIAIKDETKRELLKVAAELQMKLGRRVDFDETIRVLLQQRKKKNPHLLIEACTPTNDTETMLEELRDERRKGEQKYARYFQNSSWCQCFNRNANIIR